MGGVRLSRKTVSGSRSLELRRRRTSRGPRRWVIHCPRGCSASTEDSERYSVTVADYRGIEKLGTARSLTCVPGAETCFGGQTRIVGAGYWKSDVHGAITYAAFKLLQQHGTPTGMTWNWAEQVEGTLLQFTNADQSRTSASIYMHDNRLYVVEGTCRRETRSPSCSRCRWDLSVRTERRPAASTHRSTTTTWDSGESPLPDLCGLRGCSAVGIGGAGAGAQVPRIRTRREDFPASQGLLSHRWDRVQRWSVSVA